MSSQWSGSSADHSSTASGRCAGRPCSGKKRWSRAATTPSITAQPVARWSGCSLIALPGIVAEHHIGPDIADLAAELLAQLHRVLELTVDEAEVANLSGAEPGRGGLLLGDARCYQRLGVGIRIPRSLGAVGHDQHGHPATVWPPIWRACPLHRTRCHRDGRRLRVRVAGSGALRVAVPGLDRCRLSVSASVMGAGYRTRRPQPAPRG